MLVRSHANGVACWQFPHQVWDDGGAGFMIGKLYNFFKSHKAKNPLHCCNGFDVHGSTNVHDIHG